MDARNFKYWFDYDLVICWLPDPYSYQLWQETTIQCQPTRYSWFDFFHLSAKFCSFETLSIYKHTLSNYCNPHPCFEWWGWKRILVVYLICLMLCFCLLHWNIFLSIIFLYNWLFHNSIVSLFNVYYLELNL